MGIVHKCNGFALVALSVLAGERLYAFHLEDHERVTAQAYQEVAHCLPQLATTVSVDHLIQADKDEDLDFLTKELTYSHYYNPHKTLDLWWRKDSSARIANLSPILQQCRDTRQAPSEDVVDALGHAVHHLQDMTVPAHVVPVSHAMWDGFEALPVAAATDVSSGWSCAQVLVSARDLEVQLKDTAEQTLKAIANLQIEGRGEGEGEGSVARFFGGDFWQESSDSSFGQYGRVGNAFGQAQLESAGENFAVAPEAYTAFKQAQMRSAVQATIRALVWLLQP